MEFFGNYRFTPTRVGITRFSLTSFSQLSVHPHTRGDHWRRGPRPSTSAGSPPHAWGSPSLFSQHFRSYRFTPTRVGITVRSRPRPVSSPVHPHTRGDHCDRTVIGLEGHGSPPHARGSLFVQHLELGKFRYTPTRVGITRYCVTKVGDEPVHPHTRGDHAAHSVSSRLVCGSPPHAWGSPHRSCESLLARRFTPTRVGIT